MKIQKSIFTLLVLAASTIFAGCNTDQFDVAPEKKIAYTDSEKAQIYALAEKYELEVVPMKQSKNQSLKSVSELEETFKAIYKQNNTKIPLFKTKDGSYTTRGSNSSARIKTRTEHNFYSTSIISNGYYIIGASIIVDSNSGVKFNDPSFMTDPNAAAVGYKFRYDGLKAEDVFIRSKDSDERDFSFQFAITYNITRTYTDPDDDSNGEETTGPFEMKQGATGSLSGAMNGCSFIYISQYYINTYGL